jgi:hypothetical protein
MAVHSEGKALAGSSVDAVAVVPLLALALRERPILALVVAAADLLEQAMVAVVVLAVMWKPFSLTRPLPIAMELEPPELLLLAGLMVPQEALVVLESSSLMSSTTDWSAMLTSFLILSSIGLWALFLMYCALHASIKSGKFYQTPWPVRSISYALLFMMVGADAVFNLTIGSLSSSNYRSPGCSPRAVLLTWRSLAGEGIWLGGFVMVG